MSASAFERVFLKMKIPSFTTAEGYKNEKGVTFINHDSSLEKSPAFFRNFHKSHFKSTKEIFTATHHQRSDQGLVGARIQRSYRKRSRQVRA